MAKRKKVEQTPGKSEIKRDRTCWNCKKEVSYAETIGGSAIGASSTTRCCPHCKVPLISGVSGWVRPYHTTKPGWKSPKTS